MRKLLLSFLALMIISSSASAGTFWKTGKVTRTLSDSSSVGKCMILLDTNIGNGCPASGWVSLDCSKTYIDTGERNYASALVAASLGKQISVLVDNAKKHSGYCVATRLDILF